MLKLAYIEYKSGAYHYCTREGFSPAYETAADASRVARANGYTLTHMQEVIKR